MPKVQAVKQSSAKVDRIAKALYESDRKLRIAEAKEANSRLREDSFLRVDECIPAWRKMCKTSGYVGEHPREHYRRLANVALEAL